MVTFEWVGFQRPSYHQVISSQMSSQRRGLGNASCPSPGQTGANAAVSRTACEDKAVSPGQSPSPALVAGAAACWGQKSHRPGGVWPRG